MDFLLDTVPQKIKFKEYLKMIEEHKKLGKKATTNHSKSFFVYDFWLFFQRMTRTTIFFKSSLVLIFSYPFSIAFFQLFDYHF